MTDRDEVPDWVRPPFRPRRGLLVGLAVAFAAWFGFLLVLYFKTVHPLHP